MVSGGKPAQEAMMHWQMTTHFTLKTVFSYLKKGVKSRVKYDHGLSMHGVDFPGSRRMVGLQVILSNF